MRQWSRLNQTQLEALREVADAADGRALAGWALATSAHALANRHLAEIRRRDGQRYAAVLPAGRFYLAHGRYPDPDTDKTSQREQSRPRQPKTARSQIGGGAADELMQQLSESGRIVVSDPDPATRRWWRQAIHAAKARGLVPAGMHVRHTGRDSGDLVVELVAGEHPGARYWSDDRLAARADIVTLEERPPHPVAIDIAESEEWEIASSSRDRAVQVLSALIRAAEARGHRAESGTAGSDAALIVEVGVHRYSLTIHDDLETVDEYQPEPVGPGKKLYDWQRVRPTEVTRPTGGLTIALAQDWRFRGRRHNWSDRSRWTLESKLPDVLVEIEARAEIDEANRVAEVAAQVETERQWREALEVAKARFVEHHRVETLRQHVTAWDEAQRMRSYSDAVEALAELPGRGDAAPLREWARWARDRADRLDPLRQDVIVPEEADPSPDDLVPFLDGWDPREPKRAVRRPGLSRW